MTTPYSSTDSPYPLLTAWYYGRLGAEWKQEQEQMRLNDPLLLPWVVEYEAAARLAAKLTQQYDAFQTMIRHHIHRKDSEYTDDLIEFHDALLEIPFYRGILQELSGNRNLLADEYRILETSR